VAFTLRITFTFPSGLFRISFHGSTEMDVKITNFFIMFSDLKGAAALTHYATVGVSQGRLGTCAKALTDYEAQTYLETFPELS
jgi:hypothetical protein